MALETVQASPRSEDFTSLSQHQAQTPGTFFGGKAVLHLQSPGATIKISVDELETQPAFASLKDGGISADAEGYVSIANVDVWVTSQ